MGVPASSCRISYGCWILYLDSTAAPCSQQTLSVPEFQIISHVKVRDNLAPFSAFTFVSNSPPMIGINVGRKAGVLKDTGDNILRSREFAVNIPDDTLIDAVHQSSAEFPPEQSEVLELGLEVLASDHIAPPRLAVAPIAMECRLHRSIAFGDTGSEFMVGEILSFHVRDDLYDDGRIDTIALRPICRLGGPNYALLGEIVRMKPIAQSGKTILPG